DVAVALEAIHLDQNLIQRLLALVMRTAGLAGTALAANGIDLVNKDDGGRMALRLLEEIAHAAGADANEHLDKFGARDTEERHACFDRDPTAEQRLAGTLQSDQQHTLGNA